MAAWRDAERRLARAVGGERETIMRQVERHRTDFQMLSVDHMVARIGTQQGAESRRARATPSTLPFHEAAGDAHEMASDIGETARRSDEVSPETAENRRTTPTPTRPGERDLVARPKQRDQ